MTCMNQIHHIHPHFYNNQTNTDVCLVSNKKKRKRFKETPQTPASIIKVEVFLYSLGKRTKPNIQVCHHVQIPPAVLTKSKYLC